MKRTAKIAIGVGAALVLMQLVILPHDNPPVTAEVQAPDDVKAVLHRACWDCHSNQTVWPWYSRVAPVSFLVYRDVVEGRKHLNFSEWDKLNDKRRAHKQKEVGEQVQEGEMPPWFYTPMHPDAKLSDADKALLEKWAEGSASR